MNNSTLDTQNARLTGDIDLSAIDNWTPIGNGTTQYTGTFDGCGYSITGLTINSTEQYVGLFGYIGADGTVKNLTASASEDGIKANYNQNFGYAGAVAGQSDGTITNCTFASGSVTGSGSLACVGGIVGRASGTVSNCTTQSEANVVGNNIGRAGGIAGMSADNSKVKILNCSNSGTVNGSMASGGIIGDLYYDDSIVSNCINNGKVSGGDAGGIVGSISSGTVSSCVSTGTGADGGVAGNVYGSGNVSNCAWRTGNGFPDKAIPEGKDSTAGATATNNSFSFTDDKLSSIVTSLTLSPNPITVNGTVAVDFILAPANPAPDGAFGDFGAVRSGEVKYTLADDGIASGSYSNGKITLTGKAVGETTMTVEVTLHTTDFSTLNNETPGYVSDDNASKLTFAVPVNVTAAASSGSGSSGSTGGGGGAGCNAGAGALALLALLPLFALKRDK